MEEVDFLLNHPEFYFFPIPLRKPYGRVNFRLDPSEIPVEELNYSGYPLEKVIEEVTLLRDPQKKLWKS